MSKYDFGTVFRRVRMHTGWTQQTLGDLVGLDQTRISAIERGVRHLRDVALVAQVATGLWIPAVLLGFGNPGTTVGQARGHDREGSGVNRRSLIADVGALVLAEAAGLDPDRLLALVPQADPTGTRHVGAADVDVIEAATAAFRAQDLATGAGPIRDLAVAQLRATLLLLDAEMTREVQPRLYLATARLAQQAGWMSYMVNQHDDARQLWLIALDVTRATDHPLSIDQTVFVLYDMASQAVGLGRAEEALKLVHLGHTAAVGPHPASAATLSFLASIQAQAHATQGNATACDRALGQAIDHFSAIDPTDESWGNLLDEAVLAVMQGRAHYKLALASHDPHAAGRAVALLRQAVDHYGPGYARPRASALTDLAGAHALAGDADTAVRVGHQALDAVTALHSPRTHDRLHVLHTALEPLHTSAGVIELREHLNATLT